MMVLGAFASGTVSAEDTVVRLDDPRQYLSEPVCGSPCTIKSDLGGMIDRYIVAAHDLVASGRTLRLDGDCFSACTLLMDLVRSEGLACITEAAKFHIHQGTALFPDYGFGRLEARFPVPYSKALDMLIAERGGQPEEGWLVLDHASLSPMFPTCPGPTPSPNAPRPSPAL